MNKDEIKYMMGILRPAIKALYGRQPLMLTGYAMVDIQYEFVKFGWFEVEGRFGGDPRFYKVRIEDDEVTSLAVGELNV